MVASDIVADLSSWNKSVDFQAAKADIAAVFHKATQGLQFVDNTYAARRPAAKAAGLLFGSYHFGTPASGADQATHFLNVVGDYSGELLVLDIERLYNKHQQPLPSMTLDQVVEFVTEIERRTGRWPGVYGGEYLKELLGNKPNPTLAQCWLWLAEYGSRPSWPNTWSHYTLWQHTDGRSGPLPHAVAGIGPCDRDIFAGTRDELTSFWSSGALPAAAAAPRSATGSSRNSLGWRPDLPDHRDVMYHSARLALEKPLTPPTKVDMRPQCPPVYDQRQMGSCTANAIAGAFQFDRLKQNLPDLMPSRLFIYYNERLLEGTTGSDLGAYTRDGIKSIASQGVCKEEKWPYLEAQLLSRPGQDCYDSATKYIAVNYYRLNGSNLDELRSCLAAGFPFVFGFSLYASFYDANRNGGIVPIPGNEAIDGGHAVLAVGYDDANEWMIIRNSWGTDVGDAGYFYMPYQYVTNTNLADDFWTIRMVSTAAAVRQK